MYWIWAKQKVYKIAQLLKPCLGFHSAAVHHMHYRDKQQGWIVSQGIPKYAPEIMVVHCPLVYHVQVEYPLMFSYDGRFRCIWKMLETMPF